MKMRRDMKTMRTPDIRLKTAGNSPFVIVAATVDKIAGEVTISNHGPVVHGRVRREAWKRASLLGLQFTRIAEKKKKKRIVLTAAPNITAVRCAAGDGEDEETGFKQGDREKGSRSTGSNKATEKKGSAGGEGLTIDGGQEVDDDGCKRRQGGGDSRRSSGSKDSRAVNRRFLG
ncbi:hypothetical protein E3N88_40330 [Mikania micrantha]|uniref:Uncharacterized protein n=1 Tax=Mikania micrantha TaxID=192012 RepID=A0A5N6LMB5_9ASTR|nr:hypothetical protein E3N88_40330 [Mikania micrantha]